MKKTFILLRSDLDEIVDKEFAYEQIKQKIWPLSQNKKPKNYYAIGDNKTKAEKYKKNTMELNHYIKSYLALIK